MTAPDATPAIRLLGPAEVRDLAGLLGLQPTKRLGQNFVIDPNTVRRIVRLSGVKAGETVLEVGPGLGSLTLGLLEAGAAVVAVEIDGRLARQLPITVEALSVPEPPARAASQAPERLTVINDDALRIQRLPGDPAVLVANLPYNVSVPVVLHLLATFPAIQRGLVMVQAEVGERIAAGPGSKIYGSPSAKAAWYGRFVLAGAVSRQVFWPVPNVDSVLVAFERQPQPGTAAERVATFALIDAAFQQRRKMLRQALTPVLGPMTATVLATARVDPTLRGEQLAVEDFLQVARAWRAGESAAPALS